MIRTDNIRKLSDFRTDASGHLRRLEELGGVEILTVNGEAKGVVMSPKVFDELAEKAHQADITAAILRGMADARAGRTSDAHAAMDAIAEKHGLRAER